jgi:hypothetical protein
LVHLGQSSDRPIEEGSRFFEVGVRLLVEEIEREILEDAVTAGVLLVVEEYPAALLVGLLIEMVIDEV